MTTTKTLLVPDIGDFKNVPVIEILVRPGDAISIEDALLTLESDKATIDVPSAAAGIVRQIMVKPGDTVSAGTPMMVIEMADEVAAATVTAAPAVVPAAAPGVVAPAVAPPVPLPAAPTASPAAAQRAAHAGPSLRKFARELGIDITLVPGSGPKGRIQREDLIAYVKGLTADAARAPAPAAPGTGLQLLPWPQVDFARFGPVRSEPLSRIRKIAGANLSRNWAMIPHVTNQDEADVTELEAFRLQLNRENEKSGPKVSLLAFLIKASALALKKFPTFNASLDGDTLVMKDYFNIGFAADTPHGLVVPVIRGVDRKGILDIAGEMAQLAQLARDGALKPEQMQGGCFSISSLGGIGGTFFTPIINAPEVAILGVCKAAMKPVWDGGVFVPRLILPLSLSWDHRVVDGAEAARFNAFLGQLLSDMRRLLL